MHADITPFEQRIAAIKQALQQREGDIATTLTLTIKALANRNVVERGFGESYSNNEVPAYWLEGKEINAGGTAAIKKAKKSRAQGGNDGLLSWKDLRQAEGLQVAHVDLTHSGRMWAGMGPRPPERQGTATVVPLGGNNREVQQEMNYNYARFGNFIERALTPQDKQAVREVLNEEIRQIINQFT